MAIVLNPNEAAIRRGIRTVGVGKKGSKSLDAMLTAEVLADLKAQRSTPAAVGAFMAGLISKGVEEHEKILEQAFEQGIFSDYEKLVNTIASDAPDFVRWVCVQLLSGYTLDCVTTKELGRFLFSEELGDGARGLVASLLRVRYETDDEYEGLWQAMQETIMPNFKTPTPSGEPIVQLSEPFDGNDHSYLITPIIAGFIQARGYRAVHMIGRNSGPKFVMNLEDITHHLPDAMIATSNQDLANPISSMGWFFRQHDISQALNRWVDIRHQIIKRPFLATLEKFIKPLEARIIIASAFHLSYGDKMISLGERAGFPGIIIIRNGMEGSIAFSLKRPTHILLSARLEDGTYKRHEIVFDAQEFLNEFLDIEEKRDVLIAEDNARLITQYLTRGTSEDRYFDLRVSATCEGLSRAFDYLEREITWRG